MLIRPALRHPEKRVLWLAVTPVKSGEWISTTPAEIHFCVRDPQEGPPGTPSPGDPSWQRRRGAHDYRETNAFFNRLQDARVAGRPLLEFVAYDGASMWQFLPSFLWPVFFRSIELIRLVGQVVDEVGPLEIRAWPVADHTALLWEGVVRAVGASRHVPVVFNAPGGLPPLFFRRGGARFRARLRWMRENLSHWRLEWAERRLRRQAPREMAASTGAKKLLFATIARHWTQIPGGVGRYDEQFYPLLPALRAAGWRTFVGIDCPYGPSPVVIQALDDRLRNGETGVHWCGFWAYGQASTLRAAEGRARRVFDGQWRTLRGAADFAADFRYRGVSLWPALREDLEAAFRHILPRCVRMLAAAGAILDRERPDAVMATYETGPFQRALLLQAARRGIPTMGLMHGMIFDDHYDYMHRRVTTSVTADPFGFIVPEITCVWGPAWKENLVSSGHYPSEAVAVTGNWRYDRLVATLGRTNVELMRRSLGLAPDVRVVLVLSSSQKVLEYIEKCLSVVAGIPNGVPLVKLHPADDPAPVRVLLHRRGYPERTLFTGPLVDALAVADLVISQPSTAVGEAVLLGKPVVLADFQATSGPGTAYAAGGVCLVADDEDALRGAVEKALLDEGVRASLATARQEFVQRYFFKIDGGAASRVVEALEGLVARQRRGECGGASRRSQGT